MEKVILTGDRPTGRLHLGHYVGSLKRRVELQNSGKFDEIYIETIRAEICYTYIYLDFIVIRPQKIIILIFLQTKISKLLLINNFVRRTHGN